MNVVSAASPPAHVPDEAALNALCQHPPPRPAQVLLLILLHILPFLLLHPPLRTPTITGTTATLEIKLSFAIPLALGFQETN